MAIQGIQQPEILQIDEEIRLRKFDGRYDFAFDWYQDAETVYMVDGVRTPYSRETLKCMYEYLEKQGELYFIEVLEDGTYEPIGDVTFWKDDMPIVIGDKAYRGRGIAKRVIKCLIERGRALGYDTLRVNEIYEFNAVSRRCFESLGFKAYEKTEKGCRFVWDRFKESKVTDIEIMQISDDSTMWNELIVFARTCSWKGTGQYFAELLEDNEFEASEKIIVAVCEGKIAGFVALVNESCVENTEFAPWLDFLFVDETYRGKGIARKLIEYVLQTATNENVDSVYLCTVSHEAMYAYFGFETLYKTKVNGGNECNVMKRLIRKF